MTPEAKARLEIDARLQQAGWQVQDFKALNLGAARGVAVTAGVTPAHFMLSDIAMSDFRTFARLSPPLRREDDRKAVIEAIGETCSTFLP